MESNFNFDRVMIIDDTDTHRYIASYTMKKHNFAREIIEFDMATKAFEFLERHQNNPDALPQVILLDIRMPVMDGFQFLEKLSSLPETLKQFLCIVMLSSSLDSTDHERAEKSPVIKRYINKPLDESKLQEINGLFKETFPMEWKV